MQVPKPATASFAGETYFGVTAMRFTNTEGLSRFGRYRIVPEAGTAHLNDSAAKAKSANYLLDEIAERVRKGPVRFRVLVLVAQAGDVVDDATIHWPENRQLIELGAIELVGPVADDAKAQKHIIFDPIPRVEGIEPSGDPLLELRATVCLISGRRRRAASPEDGLGTRSSTPGLDPLCPMNFLQL